MRAALAMLAFVPMAVIPGLPGAGLRAAPVERDWSQVATRLPGGTFLQGNPRAKVKVVEYLSLTCPHCSRLAATVIPEMTRTYIRTGKVSYEVRHATRDAVDLTATLLARCTGPRGYFTILPALFATQQEWVGRGYSYLRSHPGPQMESNAARMTDIARSAGLDTFFAAQNLPPARQAACLADMKETTFLSKMAGDIWKPGFPGTPLVEINGLRATSVNSWDQLKAQLVAAGA